MIETINTFTLLLFENHFIPPYFIMASDSCEMSKFSQYSDVSLYTLYAADDLCYCKIQYEFVVLLIP